MKKNLRIVSAAAAALLAVAPIATSVVPSATSVVRAENQSQPNEGQTTKDPTTSNEAQGSAFDSTTGGPYFVNNKNVVVSSGTINLKENSVKAIADAIKADYKVAAYGTTKPLGWYNLESDIRASLTDHGITVNADGTFAAPANTFSILVRGISSNGHNNALNIYVNAYNAGADYSQNPVITYNKQQYNHSQKITLASDANFDSTPVNGTIDTAAIQRAFTATVSAKDSNILTVSVDTSKVNTAVAGTYPVTVTAKNPAGNTVTLTFDYIVGVKGAKYQTATSADGNAIPVYSINGNSVSQTSNTIANNSSVATFGTVTVNGTSYTRINSATANQFVLTSVFNKQTTTEQSESHRVMVDSRAYDKNGNFLGHIYAYNTNINIVPKVETINGKTYYKVAGKDEYVRVTNITGTQRRLTRNAYIYWSSYRRTPGTGKMYRGQSVTTYGAAVRFKNGKYYYRIQGCSPSNKRYIKRVNFF